MTQQEFAERWGFAPGSVLLTQALTHRSAAPHPHSNERLEFFGDALLNLYVARLLMEALPDAAEGPLTLARASVVDRETQADAAHALGIPELLRIDAGGQKMGLSQQTRLLSGAYEALVGALYLEAGEPSALAFVEATLKEPLQAVIQNPATKHPKSRLQEALQAQGRKKPEYRTSATQLDAITVSIEVLCEGLVLGQGTGRALRAAEKAAALSALAHLTDPQPGSIL
ncbi:ribonuclease III family protein [Armatimonas sp.]|uniref:ribonuclease III family protein n=1 Tax=Armatimonas sp. TaxID=1872638 RepID=UPI0037512ECD